MKGFGSILFLNLFCFLLCLKATVGADSVAASGEVRTRPLGGPSRELRVTLARFGSLGAGPLGVKFLEEAVARPDSLIPKMMARGWSQVLMMSIDPC